MFSKRYTFINIKYVAFLFFANYILHFGEPYMIHTIIRITSFYLAIRIWYKLASLIPCVLQSFFSSKKYIFYFKKDDSHSRGGGIPTTTTTVLSSSCEVTSGSILVISLLFFFFFILSIFYFVLKSCKVINL